tara:strand:- start:210 stop:464 length:255 start_codon:yes stop_codon:yes gene_type:complete
MTLATVLSILVILVGVGAYLVRVGKKIAKADQADEVYEDISEIHNMAKDESKKANEIIKNGSASSRNSIANAFPRVRNPFIKRK